MFDEFEDDDIEDDDGYDYNPDICELCGSHRCGICGEMTCFGCSCDREDDDENDSFLSLLPNW